MVIRYLLVLLLAVATCGQPAFAQAARTPNDARLIASEQGFQADSGVWTVGRVTVSAGGSFLALLSRPGDRKVFRLEWRPNPDYQPGNGLPTRFAQDYRKIAHMDPKRLLGRKVRLSYSVPDGVLSQQWNSYTAYTFLQPELVR